MGEPELHWFWTESIWLPEGYTWKDYESTPTLIKADVKDLYYVPLFVLLLTLLRFAFEKYLAKPFCVWLGIKDNSYERNKICEIVYNTVTKYPKGKDYDAISKESGMTTSEVNTWFRKRRLSSRNSKMRKATETCWRALFYFFLFVYGSFVILRTDWLFDSSKWLPGYLKHPFTLDIKIYYFLEISFYFSLLFSQFIDVKRKDFMQQFIHHVATLTLLLCSYTLSLYRFGALIMYIHDTSDFWLETAKLTNYAKLQKCCDVLFGIFAVMFFITRLVYYPIYIAYGYFYYQTDRNGIVVKSMVCLCYVLVFLNFYWGYLVAKLAYKVLVTGNAAKDDRSDTEESEVSED